MLVSHTCAGFENGTSQPGEFLKAVCLDPLSTPKKVHDAFYSYQQMCSECFNGIDSANAAVHIRNALAILRENGHNAEAEAIQNALIMGING